MRGLVAALVIALAGCAAGNAPAEQETREDVVSHDGRQLWLVVHLCPPFGEPHEGCEHARDARTRVFRSDDGGRRWKRVTDYPADVHSTCGCFLVSREWEGRPRGMWTGSYEIQWKEPGRWLIWRGQGVSWRLVDEIPCAPDDPPYCVEPGD